MAAGAHLHVGRADARTDIGLGCPGRAHAVEHVKRIEHEGVGRGVAVGLIAFVTVGDGEVGLAVGVFDFHRDVRRDRRADRDAQGISRVMVKAGEGDIRPVLGKCGVEPRWPGRSSETFDVGFSQRKLLSGRHSRASRERSDHRCCGQRYLFHEPLPFADPRPTRSLHDRDQCVTDSQRRG